MPIHRRVSIFAMAFVVVAVTHTPVTAKAQLLFNRAISWVVRPGQVAVNSAVSRGTFGEFIFVQPLHAVAEAIPAAGQIGILPGIFGKKSPASLAGQRFMAVTGGQQNTPYCSLASITNKGQRLCLIDANEDGRFDYQIRAFGLGNGAPYERMLPANIIPADIPYTLRKDVPDPLMYAGLVVRKAGKAYAVKFAVSEKGKPNVLELFAPERSLRLREINVVGSKFTADQLPLKVGIYGAVVEILSVTDDSVSYRLISGFEQAERIIISRSGTLPIPR